MEENMELVYQDGGDNAKALLAKWLKFLLTVQLVSIAVSVISVFGILGTLIQLVSIGVSVCVMVALFQLSAVNERYRKAFIFTVVQVIGTVGSLLMANLLFSLAISVGGLVAMYQQYQGHSEVTESEDPDLSRKWHSLFIWQLVVGVILGLLSVVAAVIGVAAGAEVTALVAVVVAIATTPSLILQVIYLLYLKKTLALFAEN